MWVVIAWDLSLGKGIDDVLANHGSDKVHEIMNTAIPYKQWLQGLERQFKNGLLLLTLSPVILPKNIAPRWPLIINPVSGCAMKQILLGCGRLNLSNLLKVLSIPSLPVKGLKAMAVFATFPTLLNICVLGSLFGNGKSDHSRN